MRGRNWFQQPIFKTLRPPKVLIRAVLKIGLRRKHPVASLEVLWKGLVRLPRPIIRQQVFEVAHSTFLRCVPTIEYPLGRSLKSVCASPVGNGDPSPDWCTLTYPRPLVMRFVLGCHQTRRTVFDELRGRADVGRDNPQASRSPRLQQKVRADFGVRVRHEQTPGFAEQMS